MVREIHNRSFGQWLKGAVRSQYLFPVLLLVAVIFSIPIISFLSSKPQEVRTRAAGAPTATIVANPSGGSFAVGQTFNVSVIIDGGGQAFNAAQADVVVGGNVTVQSLALVSPSSGGCNFTFINPASTPTAANPSFVGAVLNGSVTRCTLYTMSLQATGLGTGTITFNNASVKSYADSSEILLSSTNGSYTVSSTTPVPTSPITPTPTSAAPKSDLTFSPSGGQITVGSTFTVQMRVNTNGQLVNAYQTNISYNPNLVDVLSATNNATAFEFPAPSGITPVSGTVSLAAGSITPKSGDVLLATLTLQAKSTGTLALQFINPIVTDGSTNTDDLKSFTNGSYTIVAQATTPTPVPPTPTNIPNPTSTPAPTNPPATPTPGPTSVPTGTPIPTATTAPTSIPTPTGVASVTAPTINPKPIATYASAFTMTGSKVTTVTSVLVNNSANGVSLPTSTTWQYNGTLSLGVNNFIVVGVNSVGTRSGNSTLGISLHRLGDIDGDNLIDLTDVSIFGVDWKKTGTLSNILSDMNADNTVDLTDFSIIAKAYGN